MRLPIPLSLSFFSAALAAYLLQLFPLTGIFLMLFAAPYWSVFLINAGFVGVALEAGIGLVSRLWLALPILWFGTYGAFVAAERLEFRGQAQALKQANTAARVSTRPSGILIDQAPNTRTAELLMARFTGLPVYTAQDDGGEIHRLHIGTGATCAAYGSMQSMMRRRDDRPELPYPDACVYSRPETSPPKDLARVTPPDAYAGGDTSTISIRTPVGTTHVVTVKSVKPLPWFPRPVMGCALISSSPEWKCMRVFDRERARDLIMGVGDDGVTGAIASAFGLTPRTRDTPIDAADLALDRELAVSVSEAAVQALGESLGSPLGDLPDALKVNILTADPDVIRPSLPALVAALVGARETPLSGQKTYAYARLIAAVSDRDLAPWKPMLSNLYAPGAVISPDLVNFELMGRLGVTARRPRRASRTERRPEHYVVLRLSEATAREKLRARSRRDQP